MIPAGTPVRTRQEAARLGLKKFWSGEPCRRGHSEMRYTRNGNCAACLRLGAAGFSAGPDGRVSMLIQIYPALREAILAHAAALEVAYLMSIPPGVPVSEWEKSRAK